MSSCKRTTTAAGIGATLDGRKLAGMRRLHEPSEVGPNGEPVTLGLRLWYFEERDITRPCLAGALCSLRFRWRLWRNRRAFIPTIREWGGVREHIRSYIKTGDTGNIPVYAQED